MSQSIRIPTCFTPTLRYTPNTNTCTKIGFSMEKKARMRACISVSNRNSCRATLKHEESGTTSKANKHDEEKHPLGGSPPSKADMGHEIFKLLLAFDDPKEPLKILRNLTRGYKSILYNEKETKLDRDGHRILSKSLTELRILKIMNGLDDPNDALEILSVLTRSLKALAYGDPNAEDPADLETKADLNYIGEIGCMVKAIFGEISTICDHVIASCGIVKVVQQLTLKVPEVALLEGNDVEQEKRMMKESGIAVLITAEDLDDAAVKMVKAMDLDDVKVDAVKAALLDLNVSKPSGE